MQMPSVSRMRDKSVGVAVTQWPEEQSKAFKILFPHVSTAVHQGLRHAFLETSLRQLRNTRGGRSTAAQRAMNYGHGLPASAVDFAASKSAPLQGATTSDAAPREVKLSLTSKTDQGRVSCMDP